ncbi:MAG: type IVB secretion system protein IcmH/DotU [Gammaproteobacteria bacterium]|nr:type IVB secretion system protein IcmH/DotU [Gammaproteobacteria bacterium]
MDDKTVIRFPNDNTVIKPRPGGKRQNSQNSNDKTQINYKNKQNSSHLNNHPVSKRVYSQSSRDILSDYRPLVSKDNDSENSFESTFKNNDEAFLTNGLNELVHCASTLLSLIIKLSNSVMHNDVSALKYKLQDEIKHFEINAGRAGIENEKILQARYVICTTLDEIVASTPWGQESDWSQQSLLSLFHGETWGGEKFYLLLERFLKEPVKNLDILELMYICISLGFQGKYRVIDNGHAEVEHLREDLYRQLRSFKNDFNKELSCNWKGITDKRGVLIRYVPLWVVGALSGVILLSMFSSFTYMLDQSSSPVISDIIQLGSEEQIVTTDEQIQSNDKVIKNNNNSSGTERLVKPPKLLKKSMDTTSNRHLSQILGRTV